MKAREMIGRTMSRLGLKEKISKSGAILFVDQLPSLDFLVLVLSLSLSKKKGLNLILFQFSALPILKKIKCICRNIEEGNYEGKEGLEQGLSG